ITKFKNFSPEKKFFLISLIVLFLAVILSIFVTLNVKKTHVAQAQVTADLTAEQTLLNKAQASLLYNDQAAAIDYFTQAQKKQPQNQNLTKAQEDLFNKN